METGVTQEAGNDHRLLLLLSSSSSLYATNTTWRRWLVLGTRACFTQRASVAVVDPAKCFQQGDVLAVDGGHVRVQLGRRREEAELAPVVLIWYQIFLFYFN